MSKSNDISALAYPADAEAHFEEIHRVLEPWITHTKPLKLPATSQSIFIENHWINVFRERYNAVQGRGGRLREIFGPFVPLFIPWVELWLATYTKPFVSARWSYPPAFVKVLVSYAQPCSLHVLGVISLSAP